ncbi:MAG: metal ABC transporter permease [Actinomycetota bacterium]|nr:metal ABC transporter permease [Actinomycetota bacterium]
MISNPLLLSVNSGTSFSINIIYDLVVMLRYPFMRNAFIAGSAVAILAGVVGYFIVSRRSSFAAHALSHVGFAGAAGAVVVGLTPLEGLLGFTTVGAVVMGALGKRGELRDSQIGIVLSFMLGLGVLFISLYQGYASEAYSILFGQILGISNASVIFTVVSAVVLLIVMRIALNVLLFASFDEEVANSQGVPTRLISYAFLIVVAITVAVAVQIIGVLLIFSLLVTPAAAAIRVSGRPRVAIVASVVIALLITWVGLFIGFYQPYPVSFFITALGFVVYLATRVKPLTAQLSRAI